MTDQNKRVAPGHRLPDEEWAKVVARAEEVRREVQAQAGGGASGGGIIVDMTARCLASKKYFPVSGQPTQLAVMHSAECPLRGGYAIALTEWFSATVYPSPPIASWQRFVDPIHRVRAVPDELGAWHASEANPLSIGWEQAGYARFTRAEWTTPDGLAQLDLLARDFAEVCLRDGIPPVWLTTAQVEAITSGRDKKTKGLCTHRQIDPDTRTDPGDNYPFDLFTARLKAYMAGQEPEEDVTTDAQMQELKVWVQTVVNGAISNIVVPEIRVHTAHNASRVIDVVSEVLRRVNTLAQIDDALLAEIKAELAEDDIPVDEVIAEVKRKLNALDFTLDLTPNPEP